MASMVGVAALLVLVLVLAVAPAYATDYTVGDTAGWTLGTNYATWASGKTFVAGDTLQFNYDSTHTVDEVSKADYDGCSSSNPIKSNTGGNTKVTLTTGTTYYICGTAGHCTGGMKLTVTVAAATPTPTTPATPSTPGGSSPAPTTPGGSSPSPPSTPPPPKKNNAAAAGGNAALGGALLLGLALLA